MLLVPDLGEVAGDLELHTLVERDLPRTFFPDTFVKIGDRCARRGRLNGALRRKAAASSSNRKVTSPSGCFSPTTAKKSSAKTRRSPVRKRRAPFAKARHEPSLRSR
jgi:hypothetical protein